MDDPPEPQEAVPLRNKTRVARETDFSAREDQSRKLRRAGEETAIEYEGWRLVENGQTDLEFA